MLQAVVKVSPVLAVAACTQVRHLAQHPVASGTIMRVYQLALPALVRLDNGGTAPLTLASRQLALHVLQVSIGTRHLAVLGIVSLIQPAPVLLDNTGIRRLVEEQDIAKA